MATIEELFVEKFKSLEEENKNIKEKNELMKNILSAMGFQYFADNNVLKITKTAFSNVAIKDLEACGIIMEIIENKKEEVSTPSTPKKSVVEFRDVMNIIKRRLGCSDAEIAKRLGVSQTGVSGYRSGKFIPRKETRQKAIALFETLKTMEDGEIIIKY